MAIIAENKAGGNYTPMESGVYVARCVSMVQIGTVTETIEGKEKAQHKVRLGFEFPTELKVFKEEKGEQPYTISKDYTLSFHEKATLRQHLEQWRGKKFTDEEAAKFDITKLLGVPCTINVVHKVGKANGNTYAEIGSISPMMKGTICPEAINPIQELSYDNWSWELFESLPEFIRKKIESTPEFKALGKQAAPVAVESEGEEPPF